MKRELNVEIKGDNTDYKKKIQDSKKETKEFAKETSKVKFDVAKPEEINRVKERLKLLKEEQQDLAELIKRRSEAHSITDISEYNERIAETTQRINTLQAATFDNFNTFTRGIRAASSSAAGFAGVLSLLGGSEEQRAKLMRTTISLMAIGSAAHRISMMQQRSHLTALIKVKYENIKASISSALAIRSETAATTTATTAKGSATVATLALQKATALWNKTIAANPIVLIVAGIAALTAGVIALTRAFGSSTKTAKGYETTLDGVVIKDEELRNSHNAHVVEMRRLQNEWGLLTGALSAHEKVLADLKLEYDVQMKEIADTTEKELQKINGFWQTAKREILGQILPFYDVQLAKAEATNKALEKSRQEDRQINEKHFEQLKHQAEKKRQEEIKAAKEFAVLTAKTQEQRLQAQIEQSRHAFEEEVGELDKSNIIYQNAEAKHNDRVRQLKEAHNAEMKRLANERHKAELEAQKEAQDFMFAESIAYWQREILLNENNQKASTAAKLALIDAETEQRLTKVKQGSEQERLILTQAAKDKEKIIKESMQYTVGIYEEMNNELSQKLLIASELHKAHGEAYDLLSEQINIYKSEINKLIADGYTAEDLAVQKLIDTLSELSEARDKSIADAARVAKSQEQLKAVTTDLATSFGAAMGAMARDGREASNDLIKQALATAMAFVINQIIQEVEWPYNLIAAAGGAAITYALFDQVPALAQGGLATAPTLAMVGDNPNASIDPEVIAPLSKLKGMMGDTSNGVQGMEKVIFEIRGDVLVGILNKYNEFQNRYK